MLVDSAVPTSPLILVGLAAHCAAGPTMIALIYLLCDVSVGWGGMLWDLSRRWPDLDFVPKTPTWVETSYMMKHVKWFAVQQGVPIAWLQVPVILLGLVGVTGSALVSFVVLRTLVNFA